MNNKEKILKEVEQVNQNIEHKLFRIFRNNTLERNLELYNHPKEHTMTKTGMDILLIVIKEQKRKD